MSTFESVEQQLLKLCEEYDIFEDVYAPDLLDIDLVESGILDSRGLMTMQIVIEDKFKLEIPFEMFVAELRNIRRVAAYIAKNVK